MASPAARADAPIRVQRTRKKGGGIPAGAIYVGRPSKWGNPFSVCEGRYDVAAAAFRVYLDARGHFWPRRPGTEYTTPTTAEDIRRELRGKNLACWCPLDQPCHADVLLKIANSEALARSAERDARPGALAEEEGTKNGD